MRPCNLRIKKHGKNGLPIPIMLPKSVGQDFIHLNKFSVVNAFFYKQRFFLSQPQCRLTFSLIELQMLLRCCLIHMTIIIVRLT